MRPSYFHSFRGPWLTPSHHLPACALSIPFRRAATSQAFPIRLDLQAIDQKWQKRWTNKTSPRAVPRGAAKAYILAMFPYPSGALHMGHLRVYTITDVLARFKHMQGYDVLHPMGWDAFGLPAENAAIERGVDPAQWTAQNVAKMKEQLKAMNGSMDWAREFMTCDPEFYKHTQRIFLLLHEAGLAYQAESLVNYDPIDRTVLANEQVDSNGYSWRSGAKVEKTNLKQWFLKITAFRDSLLDDLELLREDGRWPERVLAMQKHWLGRSEGARIQFAVKNESSFDAPEQSLEVFTTRPDTLFGVQYLAVSASHPLVQARVAQDPDLSAFVDSLPSLPPDSKAGFQLSSVTARNPLSSLPRMQGTVPEPLPIFVAPYVLDGYGSGAVMGVPGHDARDNAFWRQNRPSDSLIYVVRSADHAELNETAEAASEATTNPGVLTSRCGDYEGLTSREASERIISELRGNGGRAVRSETWRLRDWLISRQRYWGTPIPIIHCKNCGAVPVPQEHLPVQLPKIEGSWLKHRHGNPLESAEEWVNVSCPSCGGPAKRDTDTMDTFACSSWYMFRFIDPRNKERPFSPEKVDSVMPVDVYVGGIEHAILHLLYARFISKFIATTDLWPGGMKPEIKGEPFQRLISQGMVHGKTYSDPQNGRFLKPDEVDLSDPSKPKIVKTGETPNVSFEKMSKSKYNGVDPSSFIAKYGADVTRAHILFQAPVSEVLEWEEERIVGIQRWFQRIWRLVDELASSIPPSTTTAYMPDTSALTKDEASLHFTLQKTVASLNQALTHTHALNTCISDLMQLTNALASAPSGQVSTGIQYYVLNNLLRLLAPFAPAFSAECWELLHASTERDVDDIFQHNFPEPVSEENLKPKTQSCAVMENGKLRFAVEVACPDDGMAGQQLVQWVRGQVKETEQGKKWLANQEGKQWKRVVVVKGGRTVNFVG